MNFARILIVARKELMDAFRDKRAVYGLLIGSVIGPVLISFMLSTTINRERDADNIEIPVVGRENAPLLIDWLEQQAGVTITAGPDDAEQAVRDREEAFVLRIPHDFEKDFGDALPAQVQIVSDGSRSDARSKVQRLRALVQAYSGQIGSLRLIARGVSPSIASTIDIENVEVSSAQQRAAQIFNMIPLFVLLAAFTAALQIATDSTAGERERGSLEPLLINPVPRRELIAGKWLAAVASAVGGMILTLGLVMAALLRVPFEEIGVAFTLRGADLALLLAATLPMALLAPAIQVYLASFARTFKEAQQYMGYVIMVPMLGMMAGLLFPQSAGPWLAPIPVAGQFELATEIIGGETVAPVWLILAGVSAAGLAVVFLWLATRLFRSERIIVGR